MTQTHILYVHLKKLFMFGCARSSLLRRLFTSCGEQWLLSSWCVWTSHCGGFSYCRAWARGHRLGSCDAQELSCSMAFGVLPWWGMEPVSPALAGGFFTTELPGKPYMWSFKYHSSHFQVYSWMESSAFTLLCTPHQHPSPGLFHLPQLKFYPRETLAP